jgi:putative holliday junction resolvase
MSDEAKGRVLALDVGTVRIGVALSDSGRSLATPRGNVLFATPEVVRDKLEELLGEDYQEVTRVLIGLPISLDGTEGEMAKNIRSWGDGFKRVSGISIEYVDERLSTVEAWRVMHDNGRDERQGRKKIDAVAAAVILQSWLDGQNSR